MKSIEICQKNHLILKRKKKKKTDKAKDMGYIISYDTYEEAHYKITNNDGFMRTKYFCSEFYEDSGYIFKFYSFFVIKNCFTIEILAH